MLSYKFVNHLKINSILYKYIYILIIALFSFFFLFLNLIQSESASWTFHFCSYICFSFFHNSKYPFVQFEKNRKNYCAIINGLNYWIFFNLMGLSWINLDHLQKFNCSKAHSLDNDCIVILIISESFYFFKPRLNQVKKVISC